MAALADSYPHTYSGHRVGKPNKHILKIYCYHITTNNKIVLSKIQDFLAAVYRYKHTQTSCLVHGLAERKEHKVNRKPTDKAGKGLRNAATLLSARFGSGGFSFLEKNVFRVIFPLTAIGFSLALFYKVA